MTPWTERFAGIAKDDGTSIHLRQSGVFEDIDFTGRGLIVYPGVKAMLPRARFARGGGKLLTVMKGAEVEASDGVFDGAGMSRRIAALVTCEEGGRLDLTRMRHLDAPRVHLDQAGGWVRMLDGYMGAFGLAAEPGDHLEAVFCRGGVFEATGCIFDGRAGVGAVVPKTLTGMLMFKPQAALGFSPGAKPIKARLTGCQVLGAQALGMAWAIQAEATAVGDVDLAFRTTVIEPGASGAIGPTQTGGGKLRVSDLGGNGAPGSPAALAWPRAA